MTLIHLWLSGIFGGNTPCAKAGGVKTLISEKLEIDFVTYIFVTCMGKRVHLQK